MREAWCCTCVYEHSRLFYWCSLLNFRWRQRVYANGVYFLIFVEDRGCTWMVYVWHSWKTGGLRECCTCLPRMSTNIHHSRTPLSSMNVNKHTPLAYTFCLPRIFNKHTPLAYTLCLSRMSTYTICVHPLSSTNVQQTYTTKIIECSYTQVQYRALHTHVR